MNTLQSHIDEALFSKKGIDAQTLTGEEFKKYALDTLYKHSHQNYDDEKIWSLNMVTLGPDGYEIHNTHSYDFGLFYMTKKDLPLPVKIAKVEGGLRIINCDIENLDDILTENCKIGWLLDIFKCHELTSLKGCPEVVGRFDCSGCEKLKDIKYAPKICQGFSFYQNGKYFTGREVWNYLKSKRADIHTGNPF